MKYWVHERYNERKFVILHKSTCKFCSDEKIALQNSKNNPSDKWHGGFDSLRDALDFAVSIDDCKIYQCKVCDPLDQNRDHSKEIGLALQDTRNLTIMENGDSKIIPGNTNPNISNVSISANKQIPDVDFFNEIKSEFPNAYLDEGKLVLPGITSDDLQQKFPMLTQEMIKSKFLGVSFNAPKIDFRMLKQAFPDIYLDDDRLILPGIDFDMLKSRFPELTQAALKSKFSSVIYNAPKVDFDTLKEKFPNIYMNGARLVLPTITFAALKSRFPYLTVEALKEKFKDISFNASDIDYKTLKDKFPNIYLKEGTLYLPDLTFSDLKQKFPDLTMEALKNNFPSIVFGDEKKKSSIWKFVILLIALIVLLLLLMWFLRACSDRNAPGSNNTSSNTTTSQSTNKDSLNNSSNGTSDTTHTTNNGSQNAAEENTTGNTNTTNEPDKAKITFDDIHAAFPDATFDGNKLAIPSANFDELQAKFPDLTLEDLNDSFPEVVFGKPNESTYCINPTYSTTADLNFRAQPSMDNVPLEVVPNGSKVIGLEEVGEWVKVAYNGDIGYCNLNFLNKDEEYIPTSVKKPSGNETEVKGKITESDANSITINGEKTELNSNSNIQIYKDNTLAKAGSSEDFAGDAGLMVKDNDGKTSNVLIIK